MGWIRDFQAGKYPTSVSPPVQRGGARGVGDGQPAQGRQPGRELLPLAGPAPPGPAHDGLEAGAGAAPRRVGDAAGGSDGLDGHGVPACRVGWREGVGLRGRFRILV